ncbi:glycosyltransferase [bacterium]|nr:glycosyltransferase [bacterium]
MTSSYKHIPKEQRKKILLICDDIRVHSGVATVAKEIVMGTAHHFNWVNLAGAIKHPEKGKRLDLSDSVNKELNISDSYIHVIPTDGYGTPSLLRDILRNEKPDAIMLFTDPRYFDWVFRMENEIRKQCPITYLNIWDDYPAPMFNRPFYESCDLIMGISKQTYNINKLVLEETAKTKVLRYVPHGLNTKKFYPVDVKDAKLIEFKKQILKGRKSDFTLFFNSRNIRRKQIPDALLAFRVFLDELPKDKAEKCHFILHTEPRSEHGTDLEAVVEYLFGGDYKDNIIFSTQKYPQDQLNLLYNTADAQILLTSNEGWGLTLTESLLVGNPIIANVTGGMQDQMRFEDENGDWLDFSADFPSNHRGTYKKHGEWAFPVYPTSRSAQGSIPTPYIFDDRCKFEDAAKQIRAIYDLDPAERKAKGLKGMEWALGDEAGFTTEHQAERVIEAFTSLFDTWEGREKFDITNATEFTGRHLNHKLIY